MHIKLSSVLNWKPHGCTCHLWLWDCYCILPSLSPSSSRRVVCWLAVILAHVICAPGPKRSPSLCHSVTQPVSSTDSTLCKCNPCWHISKYSTSQLSGGREIPRCWDFWTDNWTSSSRMTLRQDKRIVRFYFSTAWILRFGFAQEINVILSCSCASSS